MTLEDAITAVTFTLTHVEKWDHSGDHRGRQEYVTFVGGPCEPGRAFRLPFKEWDKMGKPEKVLITVEPCK